MKNGRVFIISVIAVSFFLSCPFMARAGSSQGFSIGRYENRSIEAVPDPLGDVNSKPSAPEGVKATDGAHSDRVHVIWNVSSGADKYRIFRSTSPGGRPEFQDTTTATEWDDFEATPGTTYYYWVKASNNAGTSPFTSYDTGFISAYAAPPNSPVNVAASDGGFADRVRVTWSASTGGKTYTVYRSESPGGDKTVLGSIGATVYDDTSATAGAVYYYWVKATNPLGTSGFSPYDSGHRTGMPTDCHPGDNTLCLNQGRFKVEVAWENEYGQSGYGRAVPFGSDDSGLLWFFSSSNWEMLIKILNGCGYNDHFWVFFAATTDQKFTLTVTDTLTGVLKQYVNPLKHPADAVTDTGAFDTCTPNDIIASNIVDMDDLSLSDDDWSETNLPDDDIRAEDGMQTLAETDTCVPSNTVMCLNQKRFKVQVAWEAEDGRSGNGRVVPTGADDSGMFWFFNQSNWELLIKVLNGCSINDRFWVFFAATTDQEFKVRVTDTLTQNEVSYTNLMKNAANAVTDIEAFATCNGYAGSITGEELVGSWAVTADGKSFWQWYMVISLFSNGRASAEEFIDGFIYYWDGSWAFNSSTRYFSVRPNMAGAGSITGTLSGNLDDFAVDGRWANGNPEIFYWSRR